MDTIHLTDEIRQEIAYFKRLNEHFGVKAGEQTISVKDADDKILYIPSVAGKVRSCFDQEAEAFRLFYDGVPLDKTDIDNLLKSKDFGKAYKKEIETITGEAIDND